MDRNVVVSGMPAGILPRAELRTILDRLEADYTNGQHPSIGALGELEPSALYWARRVGHPALPRRLARLFRLAGQNHRALALFEEAFAIDPLDLWTAIGFSAALDTEEQTARALDALGPLLDKPHPNVAVLSRAAILARKLGDVEGCLKWRRQAAQQEPGQLAALVSDLSATGHSAEALSHARQALANKVDDPELAFRCYIAVRRFSPDEGEACAAAEWLVRAAAARNETSAWRARVHRWEGRFDEALAEIIKAVRETPDNAQLVRECAQIALARGHWGRDAEILLAGRDAAANMPELRASIEAAEGLLEAFGGSLAGAAANPAAFAGVKTPESVFDHIADSMPVRDGDMGKRRGIVMIAPSLAAGGAERILATSFRHISQDPRFGWAKLYLCDVAPGKDFYLPLSGLSHPEVVLLRRDRVARPPLSWLPAGKGRLAQSIWENLERDRPAVVHAWLEPLDVIAGLSAVLAGVPRIILHAHNMVPLKLRGGDPFIDRLRDCYRALLRRPEVSLICCAEAAARDYAEWLELPGTSNLHVVHNGVSTDELFDGARLGEGARAPRPENFSAATAIVGTAFRFAEIKRPLLWVDVAALVLRKMPGCRFVMFGDGDLRGATEEYIRDKGLSDYFLLPGLVPDPCRRLPQLDLFVLSSRSEALPNVLLEAQAAGVPVVAYDVGGVAETFIDGVTGILVREDSAAALAAAVLQALSNPAWLASASKAGRAFVKARFSTQRMIEQLSGILLDGGSTRAAAGSSGPGLASTDHAA